MAVLASLTLLIVALQSPQAPSDTTRPTTRAALATEAPAIDGRDADAVWRTAPIVSAFRQFQPREDSEPTFKTEVQVAYDAHNFYAFIRAYDAHPDSILRLLARRDIRTASDQLKIIVDSYHDRRSGYEFAVNPAGVKRDYAVFDDNSEDDAWDGVWEVATQIDSLGWTAEFRIPLSQMRYVPGPSNTFGFGVWRDIDRYTERVSWPLYRTSRPGLMSQLGDVTGLDGLGSPTRLEMTPYVVSKNVPLEGPGFDRGQRFAAGADVKYGLTSNITIDATVNPDFGQVEADPSVLNLGAFETFFQERRPFFVEGTGIFQFGVNCSVVNCNGENLFYSRRVGHQSKIIGAAKLTGRLPGGLTIGVLEGLTNRETAAGQTLEPLTNYAAMRLTQDLRKGESGIGVMATAVNRNLDQWTEDGLRRSAYVGALNFRHRFHGGRYQLSGSVDASRVAGTPAAIAATQRSTVHAYQRPDGALVYDTTRTSLTGDAEELLFRRTSGFVQFETSYLRRSPGFELNDLGFLLRADQQSWSNWASLNWLRPFLGTFQRGFWNFNWWQYWTTDGLSLERAGNTNAHFQLNNRFWVHFGGTAGQLGKTFCDRCARGGPAVRVDPYIAPWWGFEGDQRRPIIPYLFFNYFRADGGRSTSFNVNPSLDFRFTTQIRGSAGLSVTRNFDDWQFYDFVPNGAGGTEAAFAHLDQKTASLSFRVDYTATRDLTVQVYASPFVSKGTFSNIRTLANPRADRYQDRFQQYTDTSVTNHVGGFNFKQFNSNVVLRWEYRPGSTLFLVWSQGRQDVEDVAGQRRFPSDFRRLFDAYPSNTFLVKMSYWLSR